MIAPVTWEEKTAANMKKIPFAELFPGNLVKVLYKSYRAGLDQGLFSPWSSSAPDEKIINHIAMSTGKKREIVLDFFAALEKTIAAGQAPENAIRGLAPAGLIEKSGKTAAAVGRGALAPLSLIAVIAVAGVIGYGMFSGFIPKPKRA